MLKVHSNQLEGAPFDSNFQSWEILGMNYNCYNDIKQEYVGPRLKKEVNE